MPHLLCLRNARAFPVQLAAMASVPFGFVLVRVRVLKKIAALSECGRAFAELWSAVLRDELQYSASYRDRDHAREANVFGRL